MEIGARIKSIRKQQKMTLQDLAAKTGLSIAFLSNLERNTTSPTLINLQNICTALGINITALLQETSVRNPVVRRGERKQIFQLDGRVHYQAMTEGDRLMRGVCMTISPDCTEEEVSWGHNADEFGVVVQGRLRMELDGAVFELEEGDSIYIPKDTPHKFKKLSGGTCVSYWVLGAGDQERS